MLLQKQGRVVSWNCIIVRMGHTWRIVEDPQMRSARRRKQEGLEPLTSGMENSNVAGIMSPAKRRTLVIPGSLLCSDARGVSAV